MKNIIAIFFLMLGLSYFCIAEADEVQMSTDEAFQKSLTTLMDLGAVPTFKDKELLLIKTDPLPVKMTTEEADCGSAFFIPYLKDKRTKVAASYQIRIKKIDDTKADVNVKITLDGYMNVNESDLLFFMDKTRDKNKVLTCTSKGVLEKQFIEALLKQK